MSVVLLLTTTPTISEVQTLQIDPQPEKTTTVRQWTEAKTDRALWYIVVPVVVTRDDGTKRSFNLGIPYAEYLTERQPKQEFHQWIFSLVKTDPRAVFRKYKIR